ncbi:hypothetical protein JOD43_002075, partial [Pullulanibacillus pueri]|uniref:hypothetical protein n=1 Tax=Pullulanibacillus pueri TaxID=1437324 RepID=UPI00195BF0A9
DRFSLESGKRASARRPGDYFSIESGKWASTKWLCDRFQNKENKWGLNNLDVVTLSTLSVTNHLNLSMNISENCYPQVDYFIIS